MQFIPFMFGVFYHGSVDKSRNETQINRSLKCSSGIYSTVCWFISEITFINSWMLYVYKCLEK